MCTSIEYYAIMAEREQTRIETLAEQADQIAIGDVQAGFPEEDCLSDILDKVRGMIPGMRGNNRIALKELADMIEQKQAELAQAAEYGMSELRDLEKQLSGLHG